MKKAFKRIFPLNYPTIKMFAFILLQLEAIIYQGKKQFLIYTMGKVGSSTVANSLWKHDSCAPIYHIHTLCDDRINNEEKVYKINPDRIGSIHNHLLCSIFLRRKMLSKKCKDINWHIVSLVRDPIQRNISSFFQTLNLHGKDLGFSERMQSGGDANIIADMIEHFTTKIDQNRPLNWFDDELKQFFGIDVLRDGFPKRRGYGIYRRDNVDALVIRLEDLNRCAAKAFDEFAGIKNCQLENTQDSKKKYYATVYREFLNQVKFPEAFLNQIYGSRYAKTFYTKSEIDTFRKKWGRST